MPHHDHAFVLNIYDAAVDPNQWQSVLDRFAQRVNAQGCVIFEWHGTGADRSLHAPHFSSYYDPNALRTYLDRCFDLEAEDQDTFERHSLRSDGIDLVDDSVIAPSLAELKRRKNVEILQKFGLLHRAAGLLNKDNVTTARFSVQYSAKRGPPTPRERAIMDQFLPHIAKALDLGRPAQQLAHAHHSLLAAMDRLSVGVCVLDAKGRVVVSNTEFQRQLEDYSAFHMPPDGTLSLHNPDDQARFASLKTDARAHGKFGARPRKEAIAAEGDTFLCIEVAPLEITPDLGTAPLGGCILYSMDTSQPLACNTAHLQQAYRLTDTEASLVKAIAEGLTNAQIADRRERSVATINAQVKSILAKTDCHTRTQLVRLMMSFGTNLLRAD